MAGSDFQTAKLRPLESKTGIFGSLLKLVGIGQAARAVLAVLKNREWAKQMGENGRKVAEERFRLDAMLDATEALYQRLLEKD